MVLKSEIEAAYNKQQQVLLQKNSFIPRQYQLKIQAKSTHIEVVSGIRRCGKSTLLRQVMKAYKKNIAYFNFEDPRVYDFDVSDFDKLDDIMGTNKSAYFFDEIQNVKAWEIFVRQLHDRGKKVFITGSNASLLSKELGTRLTGRHLRHELFPFSYNEFLAYKKIKNSTSAFENYIEHGGFPEYLRDLNIEVLQLLLKDIVLRDIAVRYSIKNTKALMDLTLYLLSNIGTECTYNSLRKKFEIGSTNSVSDYLTWLEDAYLLYFLPRFSYKAKNIVVNARKVYAVDNGLINANTLSFSKDKGRLLENAVYLFLRQLPYRLFYFRENKECDFVAFEKEKCKLAIQVCEEVHSDNKDRELAGLMEAMSHFNLKEGYLVTKKQKDTITMDNKLIHLIPATDFFNQEIFKN
ncbi:MAG: ATP-binding protein [Bacteroidia bacterium]|nr:ATP-binding protein [Bacteroidia bacterium]